MPIRERVIACGITGSGKSYQWLKMAETLLPTGSVFRCLDTDNAISYMLETQFPHLKPENKGNVYVCDAFDWPHYRLAMRWALQKQLPDADLKSLSSDQRRVYSTPIKPDDWITLDMADNAWDAVQNYFVDQVFGEDPGEYFLQIRKEIESGARKTRRGGQPSSVVAEGLDGWKDWSVINKLYGDWIYPIVYAAPCHVYATTKVDKIYAEEKDAEVLSLFGEVGIRPAGQKKLGHQMHTVLLFIPGKDKWYVSTLKDRAGRPYFNKAQLISFYMQYLVAKAGWQPL